MKIKEDPQLNNLYEIMFVLLYTLSLIVLVYLGNNVSSDSMNLNSDPTIRIAIGQMILVLLSLIFLAKAIHKDPPGIFLSDLEEFSLY